jgi:hypothetical protein
MKTKSCLESCKRSDGVVKLSACLAGTAPFAIENTEAFPKHHTCTRIHEGWIADHLIAAMERKGILIEQVKSSRAKRLGADVLLHLPASKPWID